MFYFTAPWQWHAFHALFLFCCAALMVGWQTPYVKWLVLIGHISFDYRNQSLVYGVDAIAACLLLILCFAPIGRALSWDRVHEVHLAKRKDLDLLATVPPYTSRWAFACTRLMQIQMAVLFFFSAVDKLSGDDWWDGDAVWQVFVSNDYYSAFLLDLFASHFWLANVATYGTILIEIAYPFLVWQRRDAALCARRRDPAAPAVRISDGPLLFLLRHDHGTHELPAPLLAHPARPVVEAQDRWHGDDLRRHLRLL